MKKLLAVLLSCLMFFSHTYSMDQPGGQEPFPFSELSPEMQMYVIKLIARTMQASSLAEAAQEINSLARTNHELMGIINDPLFCLKIIKKLSKRFNVDDADAAKALATKEAKRRFAIQQSFINLCMSPESFEIIQSQLELLLAQGLDLEFTMNNMTPLIAATQQERVGIVTWLLAKKANINGANKFGITPLMCCVGATPMAGIMPIPFANFQVFELLISQPNININQKDLFNGNTALIYALRVNLPAIFVQKLLNAGADPELGNNYKASPRYFASKSSDPEVLALIDEAIAK